MNKMKPEPLTDDMCSCWRPTRKLLRVGKSMGVSTSPSTLAQSPEAQAAWPLRPEPSWAMVKGLVGSRARLKMSEAWAKPSSLGLSRENVDMSQSWYHMFIFGNQFIQALCWESICTVLQPPLMSTKRRKCCLTTRLPCPSFVVDVNKVRCPIIGLPKTTDNCIRKGPWWVKFWKAGTIMPQAGYSSSTCWRLSSH